MTRGEGEVKGKAGGGGIRTHSVGVRGRSGEGNLPRGPLPSLGIFRGSPGVGVSDELPRAGAGRSPSALAGRAGLRRMGQGQRASAKTKEIFPRSQGDYCCRGQWGSCMPPKAYGFRRGRDSSRRGSLVNGPHDAAERQSSPPPRRVRQAKCPKKEGGSGRKFPSPRPSLTARGGETPVRSTRRGSRLPARSGPAAVLPPPGGGAAGRRRGAWPRRACRRGRRGGAGAGG